MSSHWRYPFALLGIAFLLVGYGLWPKHHPIPVLIYHNVATGVSDATAPTVDDALFVRELDYLKQRGFTPLTFAAAQILAENNRLPEHAVILTFDDGLPGQITYVLPQLTARAIPAVFFINSDHVGDDAHMSWQNIRSIAAAGMEVGGHSKTHAHLMSLTDTQLSNDVSGDKANIEHEIGKPISVFASPYQEHDARTDAVISGAGYTIVRDDAHRFKSTVMTNSFDAFLKAI